MADKKQGLSDVLNLRVDEAVSREIDRIATVEGTSASEAARKLLGLGVEVQRQVEASYLRLPYALDRDKTRVGWSSKPRGSHTRSASFGSSRRSTRPSSTSPKSTGTADEAYPGN